MDVHWGESDKKFSGLIIEFHYENDIFNANSNKKKFKIKILKKTTQRLYMTLQTYV